MVRPYKYEGNTLERKRAASKAYKERNPDKVLNKRYKERYGITLEEYRKMLFDQKYKCFICGIDEKESRNQQLCVDHCHTTGKVRKLLCHNCNCGLGHFKDDPKILKNALKYLTDKVKW